MEQRIARHLDIDTRRAMGFGPQKLPDRDFNPHPVGPSSWRYWPSKRTAIYFEATPEIYMFEVHTELIPVYETDGSFYGWKYNRDSTVTGRWEKYQGDYAFLCAPPYSWTEDVHPFPVFQFRVMPDFVTG